MNKGIHVLTAILSMLLISGCYQPAKDYAFVRLDRTGYDIRDTLNFTLDITDTLSTYNISIAARVDNKFRHPMIDGELFVTTPSGKERQFLIHIPTDELITTGVEKASSHTGIYDIEWRWAEDIILNEGGRWSVGLLIKNSDGSGKNGGYTITGIHEIGINFKTNERKR